jgi:cobalt/nickel transport system permease protein
MMIGHLTLAGLAEAAISAGMVAYLQRADLGLLRGGIFAEASVPAAGVAAAGRSEKRLWLTVALLMLLTPVGVLAVGTAWGEWSSADLARPETRAQIAAASQNQALPSFVPAGLQKLSALWTAPFPGYAPRFIKHPAVGYLLSAMFGVGFLVTASLTTRAVGRKWREREPQR